MPERLDMEKTLSTKYSLDEEYCQHLSSCLVYALYFGLLIVKIHAYKKNSEPHPPYSFISSSVFCPLL
jgi:hypothetical protein